jgi:hypothetical protein
MARKRVCDYENCEKSVSLENCYDLPSDEKPWFLLTREPIYETVPMDANDPNSVVTDNLVMPRVQLDFCSALCAVNYLEDNGYKYD